jgi:hypothetical protein
MKRHFWIRARLFLRRARWGFAVIGTWFLLGTLVFRYAAGLRFQDAILNAVYLKKSASEIWDLYSFWGQCVLFGIVISIFFLQALQRYNPQEGCRMLAGELRNHVIVVGYTHLGARIVEHLREKFQGAYHRALLHGRLRRNPRNPRRQRSDLQLQERLRRHCPAPGGEVAHLPAPRRH